jgi:hypothetical protein
MVCSLRIISKILGVLFVVLLGMVHCWNEWDYKVTWSEDPTKVESNQIQWHAIWDLSKYRGDASPPRPRRGHSLHLVKTDERSDEAGQTYIVLFGGRDNDQKAIHIPRTYDVQTVRLSKA